MPSLSQDTRSSSTRRAPEIVDRSDRWMRLTRLAVGGADERDSNPLLTEVHQHAAMEDLVVGMREGDEQ